MLARSAVAVVLLVAHQDPDGDYSLLVGCSRQTGKRRRMDAISDDTSYGSELLVLRRLVGSHVLYEFSGLDDQGHAYGDALRSDDALNAGWHAEVRAPSWLDGGRPAAAKVALDTAGNLAWVTDGGYLLWQRRSQVRVLDRAAAISNPQLDGRWLRWMTDGTPRRIPLTAGRDLCRMSSTTGSAELAVYARGSRFAVCRRASGVTLTTSVTSSEAPGRGLDLATTWAVLPQPDRLLVFGTIAGVLEAVHVEGRVLSAAVDDAGSLAWVVRVPADGDPAHQDLWVRDVVGPRVVASAAVAPGEPGPALRRGGSTITWGTTTYKLMPRR